MRFLLRFDWYISVCLSAAIISLACGVLYFGSEKVPNTGSVLERFLINNESESQPQAEHAQEDTAAEYSKFRKEGASYQVTLEEGDTLEQILSELQIERKKSHLIAKAVNEVCSLTKLKAGEDLQLSFQTKDGRVADKSDDVAKVIVDFANVSVQAALEEGSLSFKASMAQVASQVKHATLSGKIYGNFSKAARLRGVPRAAIMDFIKIFSHQIDFQRDLSPGDRFTIVHEYYVNEKGVRIKDGGVLYAKLETSGKKLEVYRYDSESGTTSYLSSNGASIKKNLLKTPIRGFFVSSGYGMRKHPVLGYSKMHKGLDYAAPHGTPIVASGDGVVEAMRSHNTYGRYIKINHGKRHATLYAHLSRFAQKMATGTRVKQGQVIGYVGATGLATGPHLHYEVHVDGRQINPSKIVMTQDLLQLGGKQLAEFKKQKQKIESIMHSKIEVALKR